MSRIAQMAADAERVSGREGGRSETSWLFRYRLNYEEIYHCFYLLAFRRSRGFKLAAGTALTVLAAVLLGGYVLDPTKVHYCVMAILSILLLFYMIYVPVLKARRGAKALFRKNGTYQIRLYESGKANIGTAMIALNGDKNACAIETEELFIIRPDAENTICIPKRIMTQDETEEIHRMLASVMILVQR